MESETLYIVGESRTNSDNAITKMYGSFYIGFEVEPVTGKILDLGCTHSLEITERFLRGMLVGRSLAKDVPALEKELAHRYYGSSQKAVVASLKDAANKFELSRQRLAHN